MPPKTFQKLSVAEQLGKQRESVQSESVNKPTGEDLFVDPRQVSQNAKTLDRIRILTSLLAGVISGLLNANQLVGPFCYIFLHLLMTWLVVMKVKGLEKYFIKKTDVFSGIGGGFLIFVCAWMIVFNIVYVL